MSILRLSSWAAKLDISHRSKLGHLAPPQSLTLANTIDFTELIVWQGISGKKNLGTYQRAPCPHRRKQNRHWCFPSVQKHSNPGWLKILYFQWTPPTNWHIYIFSNIDLAYIIAIYNICDNITHVLTFYLRYVLAFYLTHIQTLYIYIILSDILSHIVSGILSDILSDILSENILHTFWHFIWHSIWHISGIVSLWRFLWNGIWQFDTSYQDSIFCSGPASFRESSRR